LLILDVITLLLILALLLTITFKKQEGNKALKILAFASAAFAVLHLIFESARWQMVPAYIATILLMLNVFIFPTIQNGKLKKWGVFVVSSLFLLTSAMASYLFPMFELPEPSGSYAVGTTEFHMVDQSRLEERTEDINDARELMVKVWYPADVDNTAEPQPYWPNADIVSAYVVKELGPLAPKFLFTHLKKIESHSFPEATIAKQEKSYPVLIFSHGLGVFAEQSTVMMEELASNGYVVFSINHTYWSMLSLFPDGSIKEFKTTDSTDLKAENENPEALAIFEKTMASTDAQEMTDLMHQIIAISPNTMKEQTKTVDTLSGDQIFVINEIEKLNVGTVNSKFKGQLDISRIGVFGFSLGGKMTMQTCAYDTRCKAGINIDGFSTVNIIAPPHKQPFMHMNSDQNPFNITVYSKAKGPSYYVHIKGAAHPNYTDFSIISPIFKQVGLTGEIDGYKMLDLENKYVLAFFDKHLKGKPSSLLNQNPADYPDVNFKSRNLR